MKKFGPETAFNHPSKKYDSAVLQWLLEGDISIQYQVYRDPLEDERPDLQQRIQLEGWGKLLLSKRAENGHWGQKFYQPKWTGRWRYDILRALDYFQYAGIAWDGRMNDAVDLLLQKQTMAGTWPLQSKHPGQTHVDMERSGKPSRWNTLRALRVLKHLVPQTS